MTHSATAAGSNPEPVSSSRRLTLTIPFSAYSRLLQRSQLEGRSLSNLAALLLEDALQARSSG